MSEQKRPITQLEDFAPTVADDPSQNCSVTTLPDTQALKRAPARKDSVTLSETQALKKSTPVDHPKLPPFQLNSYEKDETSTPKFEDENFERPNKATPRGPYDEFMALDQAGPAMIGSENTKEPNLVAIKRVKKTDKIRINRITPFTSDHLVQIRSSFSTQVEEP